jgi:hypothetical protein
LRNFILIAVLLALVSGCSHTSETTGAPVNSKTVQNSAKLSSAGQSQKNVKKDADNEEPNTIIGVAKEFNVEYHNVKTGQLIWKAHVKHANINSESGVKQITGELSDVDGILYGKSQPSCEMLAPTVLYEEETQIARAKGGVKVKSLTRKGAYLTCDRMVYFAKKERIVGIGHVVYHDPLIGETIHSDTFAADPKLNRVEIPAPTLDIKSILTKPSETKK